MATQEDKRMMSWRDYFRNALQPQQLPQKPQYTQNSPTNDLGYTLGQALGAAIFGEKYPQAEPNAGINQDLSQAQSDAYTDNAIRQHIALDPNSEFGKMVAQNGTGFESQPTWEQQHDMNNIASQMKNTAWNNASAADAANKQFSFDLKPMQEDYYKNNSIGSYWKRW